MLGKKRKRTRKQFRFRDRSIAPASGVIAVSEWLYPEATFLKWRFPQENATFQGS
jgi:hypothetical protein